MAFDTRLYGAAGRPRSNSAATVTVGSLTARTQHLTYRRRRVPNGGTQRIAAKTFTQRCPSLFVKVRGWMAPRRYQIAKPARWSSPNRETFTWPRKQRHPSPLHPAVLCGAGRQPDSPRGSQGAEHRSAPRLPVNPLRLIAEAVGRVQVWGGCHKCGSRLARLQSGLCPACVKAHEEATEQARRVDEIVKVRGTRQDWSPTQHNVVTSHPWIWQRAGFEFESLAEAEEFRLEHESDEL